MIGVFMQWLVVRKFKFTQHYKTIAPSVGNFSPEYICPTRALHLPSKHATLLFDSFLNSVRVDTTGVIHCCNSLQKEIHQISC